MFFKMFFLPIYTDVFKHVILSTYPSSGKESQAYYSMGFEPSTFAILLYLFTKVLFETIRAFDFGSISNL